MIPASGVLDCDGGTEENHLRVGVIETEVVSDGGSTQVTSGLGGVGGITFVTGYCGASGIGGSVGVGSIAIDDGGSSTGHKFLGFLEDKDGANQERLLGIDLMSASGRLALVAWESETDTLAGMVSRCSSGGGAATASVVEWAVSTSVDCSPVDEGGACLASSFRETLEELRLDNDASYERGCGTGFEPHGSGEGLATFGSEAGGPPMSLVGDEERIGCTRSGCSSSMLNNQN